MALKVEVEMQDAALVDALETALVRVLPLAVDDFEGQVDVRRAGLEADDAKVARFRGLEHVLGRDALVDEVGVKEVELVALDRLGRRVVFVVVRLVVLVPVVPGLDAVEEARLPRLVLGRPRRQLARDFVHKLFLLVLHALVLLQRHH